MCFFFSYHLFTKIIQTHYSSCQFLTLTAYFEPLDTYQKIVNHKPERATCCTCVLNWFVPSLFCFGCCMICVIVDLELAFFYQTSRKICIQRLFQLKKPSWIFRKQHQNNKHISNKFKIKKALYFCLWTHLRRPETTILVQNGR